MAVESGLEQKNEKKPNIFVRIGRWFKGAALELKKATWPKAGDVFKKLGTVMIVVLFFFLILLLMDYLLGLGYTALTDGITAQTVGKALDFSGGAGGLQSVNPIWGR